MATVVVNSQRNNDLDDTPLGEAGIGPCSAENLSWWQNAPDVPSLDELLGDRGFRESANAACGHVGRIAMHAILAA